MTRIIRRYFIIIISRVKIKTQGHFCLLRVQGGTREMCVVTAASTSFGHCSVVGVPRWTETDGNHERSYVSKLILSRFRIIII